MTRETFTTEEREQACMRLTARQQARNLYTNIGEAEVRREIRRERKKVRARLEYLRKELRAERISYGEIAELQSLADYIPADDEELREAAGMPE